MMQAVKPINPKPRPGLGCTDAFMDNGRKEEQCEAPLRIYKEQNCRGKMD